MACPDWHDYPKPTITMKSFSADFNSFQPLLEDHSFSRLFCWRIREGIKHGVDPQRIARYVQNFWQQSLSNHLKEEEMLLLTNHSCPVIQKVIADHLILCNRFTEVCSCTDPVDATQLNALAQLLDEHIQYEEKILFPHLKNTLNRNLLKTIHSSLTKEKKPSARVKYLYRDEFWKGTQSSL